MDKKTVIDLASEIKYIAGQWPSYTLLGSFILYIFGYLSLRFHLTALGIGTDLTVLDDRYIFTGIKFLIYLISVLPTIIFIIVLVYFPLKWLKIIYTKLRIPFVIKFDIKNESLAWVGIFLSLILIQLIMRQSFLLQNLLVANRLPDPIWLGDILTNQGILVSLYFPFIIIAILVNIIIWWNLKKEKIINDRLSWLKRLLALLCIIQVLLLPINYGVLIMDKIIPRVSTPLTLKEKLYNNSKFWLVWEGNKGITYLVKNNINDKRKLITINNKKISYQEILCYENLVEVIFRKKSSCI